jgi:hypothetical protein
MSIANTDACDYKSPVGRVVRLTDPDLERSMRFFETTVGTIDCATLFTGEVYDWTQLDLVGWCNSRGMLTEDCSGYHVSDYFRDGRYLGCDDFGVCPVFTRSSVQAESTRRSIGLVLDWAGEQFTGADPADAVESWIDAGIDDEAVVSCWVEIGVWDPTVAAECIAQGITSGQLQYAAETMQADNLDSPPSATNDPIYAVCNGDLSLESLLALLK